MWLALISARLLPATPRDVHPALEQSNVVYVSICCLWLWLRGKNNDILLYIVSNTCCNGWPRAANICLKWLVEIFIAFAGYSKEVSKETGKKGSSLATFASKLGVSIRFIVNGQQSEQFLCRRLPVSGFNLFTFWNTILETRNMQSNQRCSQ